MRILIFSQYFWPETFRINEVSETLSDMGHKIEVVTGKPNYPFGKLFKHNIEIYLYPLIKGEKLVDSSNLQVEDNMKNLYKYFKDNQKIRDIEDFNKSLLNIYSWEVLEEIKNNSPGWEQKLPEAISKLIKEKKLFGYSN